MLYSTLRAVGGSVMFAIPKPILEGLGLRPNAQVGLSVADGQLIVVPRPRRRYTLAQLLAECDPSAPPTDDDVAWLADGPAGREAL